MARIFCPRCGRPATVCVCSAFRLCTKIATTTRIVIVQDPKERRRFGVNSVKIVEAVLSNLAVVVGRGILCSTDLQAAIASGSALLLYPGPGSLPIEHFAPCDDAAAPPPPPPPPRRTAAPAPPQTPPPPLPLTASPPLLPAGVSGVTHLVLIDGTWRQAKQLAKHNPAWFRDMRRVFVTCTAVSEFDRYGVRREPAVGFVSTLEALVEALRVVEPGAVTEAASEELMLGFRRMLALQRRFMTKEEKGLQLPSSTPPLETSGDDDVRVSVRVAEQHATVGNIRG